MYTYVYIYIYIHMYTYIHIYIYIYTYICALAPEVEMLPEISKGHNDAKKKLNAFR